MLYNKVMYLCRSPHAGKEPTLEESADYWYGITPSNTEDSTTITRNILDGGFATTLANDAYQETDLVNEITGGSASDRATVPLI